MMPPHTTTTIDLLRHGKPQGGSVYRGSSDDPLTELGWSQMRATVAGHHPWSAIISSPLKRCAEFAVDFAAQTNLNAEIVTNLQEIHFGDWEGMAFTDIIANNAQLFNQHMYDPLNYPPPNAEQLTDFASRISQCWADITARFRGKHLLIVSHGGVLRIVLHIILQIPLHAVMRIAVPYAGITRIRIDHYADNKNFASLVFHAGKLR